MAANAANITTRKEHLMAFDIQCIDKAKDFNVTFLSTPFRPEKQGLASFFVVSGHRLYRLSHNEVERAGADLAKSTVAAERYGD